MSWVLDNVSRLFEDQTHPYPTDPTSEPGMMNVLLGPTSLGKTSLMRIMEGLDAPATGRMFWEGKDVTGVRVQDRAIAMVYQQVINSPSMSVYDNIASPLKLMGKSKSENDTKAQETAGLMKLTPMLSRKPLDLSGGQQQRYALARAQVKGAGLVLLCEPLANLDCKLREELCADILRIFRKSGSIFVYATTVPEAALLLGGNTATLSEGRITQFGPAPSVYRQPKNATMARVFSDPPMNFTRIVKAGDRINFGEGQVATATGALASLADGTCQVGFRADHLHLFTKGNDGLHCQCRLRVTRDYRSADPCASRPWRGPLARVDPWCPQAAIRRAGRSLAGNGPCPCRCRTWRACRSRTLCRSSVRGSEWHG